MDWTPGLDSIICSEHFLLTKVMEMVDQPIQISSVLGVNQSRDQDSLKIPCDENVCRICLATDSQMHSMTESEELTETYEVLTGILIANEVYLPRYLCTECADKLTNCALLRCRSLRAHLTLLDIVKRHGRVTTELVKSLETNTLNSDPEVNPIEDDLATHDEDLHPVNRETDASVTKGEDIDISVIDNISEVDNASDHTEIHSEDRGNEIINISDMKIENDRLNNEDLNSGSIDVKLEIMVDKDIREDSCVSSFNVNKESTDIDIENGVINQEIINELASNEASKNGDAVNNVVKMEYIDVTNDIRVKVEPMPSNYVDYQPTMSIGEDVGDPLSIQAKGSTMTTQDLREVKTDNQYTVVVYSDEKPYSCACKMAFKYKHELESHLITTHSDASLYFCDVCEESFKRKSHLKSHLVKVHPGRKPHACDICEKVFKHQYQLKSHSIMHSDEKPYSCPICKKALRRKGQLRLHYLTQHSSSKPYSCSVCKKCFTDKRGLQTHSTMHSVERPYSCHICKRRYKCKNSLRLHLITHSDEKPYSCDVCNKSFILKNVLKSHLTTHSNEKPYTCHICKKPLKSKSSLRSHLTIHSGKKPYSCDICQKAFYHKTQLGKHIAIHSDEKPYTCDVCKKSLKTKRTLQSHVRTHFDDKSYSCDFCKKNFRQKRLLKSHLLRDACNQ